MTPRPLLFQQGASLLPRPGVALPEGVVPPEMAPAIVVAAEPSHPSNAVLVALRREGGPTQFVRARRQTEAGQGGGQAFSAALPALEIGRRLDYRVELTRAGQRLASLPADGSWLTVTGGPVTPPMASSPAPASPATGLPPARGPRFGYRLSFFAALTVNLRAEIMGETPEGYRINFFVKDGTVVGPDIKAVVQPEGGDWMAIRRDGIGEVNILITYQTADGALILERAGGIFDIGPDGFAKVAAGQFTGSPPFYATPTWSTAHPRWRWLNRCQGFGIGRVVLEQLQVQCDIYLPQTLGRLSDA